MFKKYYEQFFPFLYVFAKLAYSYSSANPNMMKRWHIVLFKIYKKIYNIKSNTIMLIFQTLTLSWSTYQLVLRWCDIVGMNGNWWQIKGTHCDHHPHQHHHQHHCHPRHSPNPFHPHYNITIIIIIFIIIVFVVTSGSRIMNLLYTILASINVSMYFGDKWLHVLKTLLRILPEYRIIFFCRTIQPIIKNIVVYIFLSIRLCVCQVTECDVYVYISVRMYM